MSIRGCINRKPKSANPNLLINTKYESGDWGAFFGRVSIAVFFFCDSWILHVNNFLPPSV